MIISGELIISSHDRPPAPFPLRRSHVEKPYPAVVRPSEAGVGMVALELTMAWPWPEPWVEL